jgi:hypothetical protein
VRGIGCAGWLRDLRDSAQSHVPDIAQRMMTTAVSCWLEGGEWWSLRQQTRQAEGYLCPEVRACVILLEGVVVEGDLCEPLCSTVTWIVIKLLVDLLST